jgi:cyanate permease
MKSSTFYTMAVLAGFINLYTTINFYWTSYAVSLGYELVIAATISSVAMWGQLCGKIGLGTLSDKNLKVGVFLAYACGFVGLLLAIFGGSSMGTTVLFVSIFFYGITHGSCAVETPILARACFGNGKEYAQIYSNIMSVGSFCAAIGSTLFGYVVDWTGSYKVVLIIGAVLSVLCFTMARVSLSASKNLVRDA